MYDFFISCYEPTIKKYLDFPQKKKSIQNPVTLLSIITWIDFLY